jgi:hypothetical protein
LVREVFFFSILWVSNGELKLFLMINNRITTEQQTRLKTRAVFVLTLVIDLIQLKEKSPFGKSQNREKKLLLPRFYCFFVLGLIIFLEPLFLAIEF